MMAIDASNFQDCLAKIAAKGGRTAARAQQLLQEVHDRGEALKETGAADPYIQAAQELADKTRQDAANARVDSLRNAKARAVIADKVRAAGGIRAADQVIRTHFDETSSAAHGYVDAWQSPLEWELRKNGVYKAAISGDLDEQVAQELQALSEGKPLGGPNGPARTIAKAISPALETMRQRLNGAGARIAKALDYITATRHDPDKILGAAGNMRDPEASFAVWRKDAEAAYANEKTYANVEPKDGETVDQSRSRFWRSVYEGLTTGIHKAGRGKIGADDFVPPSFEGSGNLARRLSEGRVLFPNDAKAWYAYTKKYGRDGSILATVMNSLSHGARDLALMDHFGTNAVGNVHLLVRRLLEEHRGDINGVRAFKKAPEGAFFKGRPSYDAMLMQLDGRANMPLDNMLAKIGSGFRGWEIANDLGGVGLTHFASIWATVQNVAHYHGVSRMEAVGRLAKAMVSGARGAEHKELLAQLGSYGNGLRRGILSIATPDENFPGWMSRHVSRFIQYTGVQQIYQRATEAAREMFANNLARNLGKDFGRLAPHLRTMLKTYGIDRGEWDLLGGVKDGLMKDPDGHAYLTARNALDVSRSDTEALLRQRGVIAKDAEPDQVAKAIDGHIQKLSDRLYAYYGDAARHAVVTPDMKQRALLLGRTQPGTFAGEMARYVSQFKFWPVAVVDQQLKLAIYNSTSKGEAAWSIGTLAALSAADGYFRMAVNDAALGYPIRNPFDMSRDKDKNGNPTGLPHGVSTMLAALAQGGGAGILGDFLFGQMNQSREGAGLVPTIGGPVVSDADAGIQLFHQMLQGKVGWPELARFGVKHVPYANLIYIKGALDYLLWYHLYEAASPGWWDRTNRRLEREQGRTMQGYAPGAPIPYTPFGIGGSP